MHIFLCGKPHVGKSTLIRKLLNILSVSPSGFVTVSTPFDRDGKSDIYIQPADAGNSLVCDKTYRIGQRFIDGSWEGYTYAFNTMGPRMLRPNPKNPLVIMDELGFMENSAMEFQKAVLNVLDGPYPVIGAVKPLSTPFLDKVKSHPEVELIHVTAENRDILLSKLIILVKNSFNNLYPFVSNYDAGKIIRS